MATKKVKKAVASKAKKLSAKEAEGIKGGFKKIAVPIIEKKR